MPTFQYTGSISYSIYNNSQVSHGRHSFNVPNFRTGIITWEGDVPAPLEGKSWSQLASSPEMNIYTWEYQVALEITGEQTYDDSSTPVTSVQYSSFSNSFDARAGGSVGKGKYDVDTSNNPSTISTPGDNLIIDIYNDCARGLPWCVQHNAEDYTFVITVIYNLYVECSGVELGLPVCFQACETCNSDKCPCLDSYIEYCLNDFPGFGVPITYSKTCQNFISNYVSQVGPNANIDSKLSQYCQNKYNGFGDLFNNNPDQIDIDLCACHMSDTDYQNFEDQIDKDYPGLGNLGIQPRCLVPPCAASVYKSVETGKICNVPKCLIINSFNNNGTFDNSTVTVNNNAPGCADINGGNISPSNNTDRRYLYIIGGVILVFVLILIIWIIIRASSK